MIIPKGKRGAELGWSTATHVANESDATKIKIHHTIFLEKIWTVQNPRWRTMPNRGGATVNHLDHAHSSARR